MNNLIQNHLRELKTLIKNQELFNAILDFDENGLKAFIAKRISYSHNLEGILEQGIIESEKQGFKNIVAELQSNLNDETGLVENGYDPTKVHLSWRNNFVKELEIQELINQDHKNYYDFHDLNYLQFLGCIVFIEFVIPLEFNYIKQAIKAVNIDISDAGMLYINDHINHDAVHHLPDLIASITKDVDNESKLNQIIVGIDKGYQDKVDFYHDL